MRLYFSNKRFTLRESYWLVYHGLRGIRSVAQARKSGQLGPQLMERVMLAVTQVNGCALCAWGHTRAALESGLSGAEIRSLLGGEPDVVPPDEVPAVLFAQHYAETGGRPSRTAWERVVALYGAPKARGILGAARLIMAGNAYGIAGGAFLSRLRGWPNPHSSLPYELAMMGSAVAYPLLALAHAGLDSLRRKPLIVFPAATSAEPA